MPDVVGSAVISISPDLEGFAEALQAALASPLADAASQVGDSTTEMSDTAKVAGEDAATSIGDSFSSLGETIVGVAIGSILASAFEDGSKQAIEALETIKDFLPELGEMFQETFNQISIATGDTGPALDNMKGQFNDVFGSLPADAKGVGRALTDTNTVLGLSGGAAEESAKHLLSFSNIAGGDASANVDKMTKLFKLFGTGAEDQAGQMDHLLRISQQTNVPLADLVGQVGNFAPKFKAAGFSIDEVASMTAKLTENGVQVGPVMMGMNRYVGQLEKSGQNGKAGLTAAFDSIKNLDEAAGNAMAIKDFGPRAGPLLADQLRQGNLAIDDMVKSVQAGGDTVEGAEARTLTWQDRLGMLTDQLKLKLEPIATAVFNGMGTAVEAVTPIITHLADLVHLWLSPAFVNLMVAVQPIWDLLGRIRDAMYGVVGVMGEGKSLIDLVAGAFTALGVPTDQIDQITAATGLFTDAWDKASAVIGPVSDMIVETWTRIKDAFSEVMAQNPGAFLAGIATVLAVTVGPVLVLIAGFLWNIVGAMAAFVFGVLAIPLAIGALVVVLVLAYNHFQTFHDIVTAVFTYLRDNALMVLNQIPDKLREITPFIEQVRDTFTDLWKKVQPALEGLMDSLRPLFKWLTENPAVIVAALMPIIPIFLLMWTHIQQITAVVGPLIAILGDLIGNTLANLINVIRGVIDIVTGLFTLDWNKVGKGIYEVASAILDFLGNIGGHLLDLLDVILPKLGEWFLQLAGNIPGWVATAGLALLGALGRLLANLPGWLLTALTALGDVLLAGLHAAWDYLVANGPSILMSFLTWIGNIEIWVLQQLGNLGVMLLGWAKGAFDWVVSSAGTILAGLLSWIAGIPKMLVNLLFGQIDFLIVVFAGAIKWVVDHGPEIISGILNFFGSLPEKIGNAIGNLGDFIHQHVIIPMAEWLVNNWPSVRQRILEFIAKLPGQIVDSLSGLKDNILGWLKGAFDWVVQNAPGIISGLIGFFSGLPGKIFDAIKSGLGAAAGGILGLAKDLWNAIAGFANENLIDPIKNHEFPVIGKVFDFLPELPKFAEGAVVDKATLGIFGEAGREALIPLENPRRAIEVSKEAGLDKLLAAQTATPAPQPVVQVYMEVSQDTTPEHAHTIGTIAGGAAAKVLGIDAAVHTG